MALRLRARRTNFSKLINIFQTANTAAANVANAGAGAVAVPAIANGATGTVTINDTNITVNSMFDFTFGRGTTTAAAGAIAALVPQCRPPTAGQVVIDVRNAGSAATLSTDYVLWYTVTN